jgi:uncharacterized protein YdhG (YjbR/CyaY superfamily)
VRPSYLTSSRRLRLALLESLDDVEIRQQTRVGVDVVFRIARDARRLTYISYQIPAYKSNGSIVIYFAGWKRHYSLYFATRRLDRVQEGTRPLEVNNKGTVRFPLDEPVPMKSIQAIVRFRAQEVAKL